MSRMFSDQRNSYVRTWLFPVQFRTLFLFVIKFYCDCNYVVINASEGSPCFQIFITLPFALVVLSLYQIKYQTQIRPLDQLTS
jgi:hypothetical protein